MVTIENRSLESVLKRRMFTVKILVRPLYTYLVVAVGAVDLLRTPPDSRARCSEPPVSGHFFRVSSSGKLWRAVWTNPGFHRCRQQTCRVVHSC